MQRSTASRHSQEKAVQNSSVGRHLRTQNRTATSQRTGQSSNHSGSAHQKPIEKPSRPKVLDENNCDVTPKPMFETETQTRIRHGSALFESIAGTMTPTEASISASVLNTNAMLTGVQSFSAFPESSTQASMDSQSNMNPSDAPQGEVNTEKERSALFFTTVEFVDPKEVKIYEKITFTETPTFTLLNIPQSCFADDDPTVETINKNNKKYLELCKAKVGNDSFADRGINTFNDLPKIKNTQTDRITINEKGAWCTLWDMYDSNLKDESVDQNEANKAKDLMTNVSTSVDKSRRKSVETGTQISGTIISDMQLEVINEVESKRDDADYKEDENFKLNAFFMERLLNQNTYQPKQARYRGLKPILSENDVLSKLTQYDGLSLEKLWNYTSSLTKDRNVSCVTWNQKNPDILAAGYGKFEFNDDQSGLVCCWSLKNPEYPERYYKTEAGVTSIAFSQKHANLLAVGLFNGNIHIYDVRTNNVRSLLSSSESDNKHLSPVWNLKWTERDRANSTGDENEMEVLMSISSDGRITQWLIRKGFESSDYLKLKRVMVKEGSSNAKGDKDKSEGLISRNTGGLCFDIWDQDKSIYLCGTEEGNIHRCSTSYNEQYLDTYQGHTGPVYKLAWSPFLKNCFLSGSSDWTIRLWKANRTHPCLTFNSSTKAVYDICWSNYSATIFCCVNENAIEIWDLSKSTLDPIFVTNPMAHIKLTSVTYSPNSDALVVGTSDGSLYVYSIKNTPAATKASDLEEIIKLSLVSQLDSVKIDEEEANDVAERHQLETLKRNPKEEEAPPPVAEDGEGAKIAKMDAFQANLDKIKSQNAKLLKEKKPRELQRKNGKEKNDNESSSDDD